MSEQLTIEILDILLGFARCSRNDDPAWIAQLRVRLVDERPRFEALARHRNDDIADYARSLLAELETV